jgi:hypothetical protein
MEIIIKKSRKPDKKLDAVIDGKKTVSFGAKNYSDYTLHKDDERKNRYINRHKKNEDWGLSGIDTAGFYAKNILWNKKTIKESVDDLNRKYKYVHFSLKN